MVIIIKIKDGNILNASENIVGHQVNTLGKMGAGVAGQLRHKYPKIYTHYTSFLNKKTMTIKDIDFCQIVKIDDARFIANLFGQETIGRSGLHTDVKMLKLALIKLRNYADDNNLSVALPYGIGAGLGGADWNDIYALIEYTFHNYPVTLYKYTP